MSSRIVHSQGRPFAPARSVVLACVGALAVLGLASERPRAQFAARVQMVEVYATATRPDGSPATGLGAGDFEVLEDGVPQQVSAFATGEFPLTVALGVDRSWSMAGEPLRLAVRASQAFLRGLRPADRTMVWAVADGAELLAPPDSPREDQLRALAQLTPWSTTALRDAVVVALDRLHSEPGRQALVLFTDGEDRYSRTPPVDLLDRVRRSHALVYSVAVGKTRPAILAEMAAVSGGRSLHARDVRGLEPALAAIASELGHQYLLGYVPGRPETEPRWRSITVRVKPAAGSVRVRARDGYVGP
jgi:VWFA-related protein